MSWRRTSRVGGRDVITPLQQEASRQGRATLASIESAVANLVQQPSLIAGDLQAVDGIVFLSQQILLHQQSNNDSISTELIESDELPVLTVCVSFCAVLESYLVSCFEQEVHQHRQVKRHHYQQQSEQALPSNAATALCSCLRQWADQHVAVVASVDASCDSTASPSADQVVSWQLQEAAISALAVLLTRHWSAVAAHERAATSALLLSLVQAQRPRISCDCSPCTCSSSGSVAYASKQLRVQTVAAHIVGQLCRPGSPCGLQQTEAASIVRALVDALACCTSGTSSSSNGGCNSSSNNGQRLIEDVCYAKYYTALLTALGQAVYEDKQGWQGYAGQITEAAGKLLSYGLRQQAQQLPQEITQTKVTSNSASKISSQLAASEPDAPEPAAAGMVVDSSGASSSKPRYVPPHLRRAAAAASATVQPCPPDCRQEQAGNFSSDTESYSDWSEASDSEQQHSHRRSSSSTCSASRQPGSCRGSARATNIDSELEHQQQQVLLAVDPIKSYRVRVAVLQLLQNLVQIDAKGLHPYLAALLPSQQPLQRRPLSPHLVTSLLYDPCCKVRQLSASLLSSLLEGPAARTLLAVAEARGAKTAVRGFTTLSVSLGQMLLSLHTGLLAAIQTWQQQQRQQQQKTSQQASAQPIEVLELMSGYLLNAVLRSLSCLVQVTPYDRFPQQLLPQILDTVWGLWQQLQQQQEASQAAATSSATRNCVTTVVAVHAHALSTKKPSSGVADWLSSSKADNRSVGSPRGQCLVKQLMSAAISVWPMLRIEALAALRGCCINYPASVLAVVHISAAMSAAMSAVPEAAGYSSTESNWKTVMSVVEYNIQETNQVLRSPRGGSGSSGLSAAAGSSTEVSADTSPEDKAAQHAVKLVGDWLAATWAVNSLHNGTCDMAGIAQELQCLCLTWSHAIELLLSKQIMAHPNYMIRTAAAGVFAGIPSAVWQQLPPQHQQRLLTALAGAAADDTVTAGRAAACKVLGSLVQLPGMLQDQQRLLLLLEPLSRGVTDSAVSVRLNASWAVANACDALKQCQEPNLSNAVCQIPTGLAANDDITAVTAFASVLQSLCSSALTAAGDSEKVRANGIRAVGALLAAWQPGWGVCCIGNTEKEHTEWTWVSAWQKSAASLLQSCLAARSMKVVWNAAYAAAGLLANTALHAAQEVSACIPGLLLVLIVLVRDSSNYKIKIHAAAALGAVQSRSTYGEVYADAVLVLIAALEAVESNSNTDKVSNQAGSEQAKHAATVIDGSDAAVTEEDGNFPNFRYLPALQAQLQQSLLHMLTMLQPSDTLRLREPLQRRRQQFLCWIQAHAAANDIQGANSNDHLQQSATMDSCQGTKDKHEHAAAGTGGKQRLPTDPFGLEALSIDQHQQQHVGSTAHTCTACVHVKATEAMRGLQRLLDVADDHLP